MADLKIIENEVKKLNDEKNHDKIVAQLQKINECFLRNVIIKINNRLEIYPVEVESYYYKKGVFEDGYCHKNVLQKNNFGKLYFHRASRSESKDALIDTSYYGGVDVCISDNDDYYLSILIRSAYIKNRKEKDLIMGIHRVVNRITDELESLLEQGDIDNINCGVISFCSARTRKYTSSGTNILEKAIFAKSEISLRQNPKLHTI